MDIDARNKKLEKEIVKVASTWVLEVSDKTSLITITNARIGKSIKFITLGTSVLPESKERPALSLLKRHAPDVAKEIAKRLRLAVIPFVDFEIDMGEKNRQRIEDLSLEIKDETK